MLKAIKPVRDPGASRRQRGYLLLEVLVSLVLLAIGILGMAGLQTVGISMNNSSLLRSNAALLANEMAERIRANLAGAAAPVSAYNSLTGSPSSPGCITSGCSSSQIAQNDYYEWSNELAAELPGGQGAVCLTSTPAAGTASSPGCDGTAGELTIKIWWQEKNFAGTSQDLSNTNYCPCLSMILRP